MPVRLATFAVGAPSPALAISCTAARRIAARFSELLGRAIPIDESTMDRPWESRQWIYLRSLVSGNSAAPGNGTPAVCTLLENSFTFRRQLVVIPSNCVSNPMKLKYYSIGTIGHKYAHLFHRLFGVVRLRVLGA